MNHTDPSRDLKKLLTELARLEHELTDARTAAAEAQRRTAAIEKRLTDTRAAIEDLSTANVVVSQHAVLRYLERVKGIDLDAIRKERLVKQFRTGQFPTDQGWRVQARNGVVVTVTTKEKDRDEDKPKPPRPHPEDQDTTEQF